MLALVVALVAWCCWRRTRFFGNTAPLIVFAMLLLVGIFFPENGVRTVLFASLPFLLEFVAGVFADLIQSKYQAPALAVIFAIIAAQAAYSVASLIRMYSACPARSGRLWPDGCDNRRRMISYSSAVECLHKLGHELPQLPARKFDLEHVRVLCRALADPQCDFPCVLIAGTNGKGSTAATLASILRVSSLRVGLYTSPHLLRVNERIRLDGQPIDDESFAAVYDRVSSTASRLVANSELPHLPSFFETVTAMAFEYFSASKVDIAVLEVGMGGRLDATNIVEPILSVITDIDLDHQKYLGSTIAEIAVEKAGILRKDVAAVTLPQHPEANRVLGERMVALGARAVNAARNMASVATGASALVHASPTETRFALSVLGTRG